MTSMHLRNYLYLGSIFHAYFFTKFYSCVLLTFQGFSCFLCVFRIEEFVDYDSVIQERNETPVCDSEFLFSMNSYDHLKGVAERKNLMNSSEYGLVNPIPQAKDLAEFGQRIKLALFQVLKFEIEIYLSYLLY